MSQRNSGLDEFSNAKTMRTHTHIIYRRYIKRILDVILSMFALIALSPVLLVISLLIRMILGSPVIFKQRRIGKDNKGFNLLKFRSMTEARDENGVYLPDPERLTRLGHFIRATSIDELPSLVNIIKGEMSIIGPRPLPVRYLPRYTKEQLRRHEVRPGLSNTAVINGRNIQTWEAQFAADVWYVDNVSFIVDVKSVIDTIKIVISREGATSSDGDSRYEFIGVADPNSIVDADNNYIKIQR